MTSGAAQAHERILFTSRLPQLGGIALMMDSLVCDSVKRDTTPLSFQCPTDSLVITLDAPLADGESLALDIFYHRRAGIPNRGFFYYAYSGSRHTLAFSCAAPYDARFWFPCYDEPFDKAEQGCAINVTVPDSLSVCSNGMLDSTVADTVSHTATYFWTHRFPIATYLMVFAVSKWVKYVQEGYSNQPDSIAVWSYCGPGDTTWVHANLRNVPDMFQFFADTARFGRYPFERYGHVYCTGFQYGGMENQTLTMLALGQVDDATISHEMSHMWWGDMVTCVDYRNIWLNEGFANYWEAQYGEHEQLREQLFQRRRRAPVCDLRPGNPKCLRLRHHLLQGRLAPAHAPLCRGRHGLSPARCVLSRAARLRRQLQVRQRELAGLPAPPGALQRTRPRLVLQRMAVPGRVSAIPARLVCGIERNKLKPQATSLKQHSDIRSWRFAVGPVPDSCPKPPDP
jgi:hypothetical protein